MIFKILQFFFGEYFFQKKNIYNKFYSLPKPHNPQLYFGNKKQFSNNKRNQNVPFKKGDWMCSKCNNLNFSFRDICKNCPNSRPQKKNRENRQDYNDDWICPKCSNLNFSFREVCKICKQYKYNQLINSCVKILKYA